MTIRHAPSPADGEAFIEALRRDFVVKKGDLYWRKRDVSRYQDSRFPARACAQSNGRFGNKRAGLCKDGERRVKLDGREWPVETLIRIMETGAMPEEIAGVGMGYVDYIIIGSHALGLALKAARAASGLSLDDLTVLSQKYDPFRFDTPERHRDAAWFAELFTRLVRPDATIHIRGFHYLLVSAGGIAKPDGTPYENTEADYTFLGDACKRARWLSYIGFDRIVDQRNPDPIINRAPPPSSAPSVSIFALLGLASFAELPSEAEIGNCRPYPSLSRFTARHPYAFAFFGEKSSLEPVLAPLAATYGADLYLAAGELSDTLVWKMARDAAADGRPLIVFTFSDFDPAGSQMQACLRLVRALAVETHENWLEAHRYLNMNDLREHKKTHLRKAA